MNHLSEVLIVATIFICIYKVIELFVHRKERINFIEKLGSMDMSKMPNANVDLNKLFGDLSNGKYWPLRLGGLVIGLGLGLLIGYLIVSCYGFNVIDSYRGDQIGTIYGACTLIFGGIGLLGAFLTERKLRKDDQNK